MLREEQGYHIVLLSDHLFNYAEGTVLAVWSWGHRHPVVVQL